MHTYRPAIHETGTNHKSFLVAIRKKYYRRKMNDSKMAIFSEPYFFFLQVHVHFTVTPFLNDVFFCNT